MMTFLSSVCWWLIVGFAGAFVGCCGTICAQRFLFRLNEKSGRVLISEVAFRGFPEFHRRKFCPQMTNEQWESQVPPHLRDHCITFVFFLESVGRAVIEDLRVTVDAKDGSGIAEHMFLVQRTVICDRLKAEKIGDKRLIGTWKYLNPGDEIELHVLVAGIDDPESVEFGVDAKGVAVDQGGSFQKLIDAIVDVGDVPMSKGGTMPSRRE